MENYCHSYEIEATPPPLRPTTAATQYLSATSYIPEAFVSRKLTRYHVYKSNIWYPNTQRSSSRLSYKYVVRTYTFVGSSYRSEKQERVEGSVRTFHVCTRDCQGQRVDKRCYHPSVSHLDDPSHTRSQCFSRYSNCSDTVRNFASRRCSDRE